MHLKPLLTAATFVLATSLASAAPAAPSCPEPSNPLSLSHAVERALCANPTLQASGFDYRSAEAKVDLARAAYLPTLSASITANRTDGASDIDGRNVVAMSWLLADFGERSATLAAAKASKDAAKAQTDDVAQDLALSVTRAFFSLQSAEALVNTARAQEADAQMVLRAAEGRLSAGTGIPLEVLQAKAVAAQATVTRSKAATDVEVSRAALAVLLAVPAESSGTLALAPASESGVALTTVPDSLAQLVRDAAADRADVTAARLGVEALRRQADAAHAQHLPKLSLTATLGRSQLATGLSQTANQVGLTLTIPLYSGGATAAQEASLRNQALSQEQRATALTNEAGYTAVSALATVKSTSEQLQAAQEMASSTAGALEAAAARYKAGVGTMLELSDALAKNASAQQSLIQARHDTQVSRAELARALGRMPTL